MYKAFLNVNTVPRIYRFERNVLDLDRYELLRAGRRLPLSRMPMELLILLMEQRGKLVTRDEIAARMWVAPESVDVMRGINTAVNRLRAVLNDDAAKPRFIETVVGKGYRFVANVEIVEEPSAAPRVAETKPDPLLEDLPQQVLPELPPKSVPQTLAVEDRRTSGGRTALSLLLIGAAAILMTGVFIMRRIPVEHRVPSLAVLPLNNLSKDVDQAYFVDGMTDQLITALVQSTSLRVTSRTSVMRYAGSRDPLPKIARALGVDAVVEGSVVRNGENIRIQIQLVDARSDRHLWAQTYEGKESNTWTLQEEITRDVAAHVAAQLRPPSDVGPSYNRPVSVAAHENYLRGIYEWNKRTSDSLQKAADYFQRATDEEPNYALAYVGLADTYSVMSYYGGPPPAECFPKAETAAKKALALDSKLGEAHAVLGDILFSYFWNWGASEAEFRQALRLNPSYAPAHHWYSELLSILGRHTEAVSEIQQARQLDPLSLAINQTLAQTLYVARRYEEGAVRAQQTIELDADYAPAHNALGWIYDKQGKYGPALAEFERAARLSAQAPEDVAALAWGYARAGKQKQARDLAHQLETRSRRQYVSPEALARVYAALGENDLAIARLQQSFWARVDTLNNLNVEPCYDSLRADPRFQDLVHRMNLAN